MGERIQSGRTPRRLAAVGVLVMLGAPALWIASGMPGGPSSGFGEPAGIAQAAPAAEQSLAAEVGPPADEDLSDAIPVSDDAPSFTTTAPRGAIDRSVWPLALEIPVLGVTAPVQAVGVGTQGEMIIPASPMDVGWYQGGSVPGEAGVGLLSSHIDTRTEGRGVLAGLVRLSEGDEVLVTLADGTVQRWSVVARTQHRKDSLPPELFARAGDPVLALVTCGGPFDASSRSYRDNVIVWARLEVDGAATGN